MQLKANIEDVINRYRHFWNMEILDRVPIIIRYPIGILSSYETYMTTKTKETETNGKEWHKIATKPKEYLGYWINLLRERSKLLDDSLPTAPTDLGPAIMCGMMGEEIFFGHGTSWSKYPLRDMDDIDGLEYHPRSKWARLLGRMTSYFVEHCCGDFGIGLANYTGPGDIMANLRGPTQLCVDLYERPDQVARLGKKCVDAYIKAISSQFSRIPAYFGGTSELYMMWTPGKSNWLTCDVSVILSPEIYRNHFFELDQQIIDTFDCGWYHVHSGGIQIVDEILKLEGLRGVQIVNDQMSSNSIETLLPMMKKIQNRHCLILRKYSIPEVTRVIKELSPRGLMIDTYCQSFDEAQHLLSDWHSNTSGL